MKHTPHSVHLEYWLLKWRDAVLYSMTCLSSWMDIFLSWWHYTSLSCIVQYSVEVYLKIADYYHLVIPSLLHLLPSFFPLAIPPFLLHPFSLPSFYLPLLPTFFPSLIPSTFLPYLPTFLSVFLWIYSIQYEYEYSEWRVQTITIFRQRAIAHADIGFLILTEHRKYLHTTTSPLLSSFTSFPSLPSSNNFSIPLNHPPSPPPAFNFAIHYFKLTLTFFPYSTLHLSILPSSTLPPSYPTRFTAYPACLSACLPVSEFQCNSEHCQNNYVDTWITWGYLLSSPLLFSSILPSLLSALSLLFISLVSATPSIII